jgi:hypothetical protein
MTWSLHKLANLLDIERNVRPNNSQIFQATYQLSKHNRIRKKITLLTTIFQIDFHRSIHRRRILMTSQANQTLGIFVLIQEYTRRIGVHLQPQKICKRTKVIHMKSSLKMLLKVGNQVGVNASNDNIIHIHK